MQDLLKDVDSKMTAAIDSLTRELSSVRTGRASAALLDTVRVDYYRTPTPVNQVASISVPDARTLLIQPWEATQLQAIEKAIIKSDLGLNPANDGKLIRNIRREGNDKLKGMARDKKVSEDDERRGHDQIQKTPDRFVAKVDELLKK